MKRFISLFVTLFFALGLWAQTDVLPPVLVSPTDGDDDQVLDVTMDWYASAGIGDISYELQYDTTSTFDNPVTVQTQFSSAKGENLFFGTTYYWRVRATDDLGTSDWSDPFHFITFAQLELDDPDDEEEDITPQVDLKWKVKYGGQSLSGIKFYDYEVAYDTNFTQIFHAGSKTYVPTTSNTVAHTISLMLFDTTYYWRVRARHDEDVSIWSEAWSFKTIDQCVHQLPANNATGQMLDVTIKWAAMQGAYEYIYELCDDPSFSSPCIFFTDENSVTAMGLLFGTTYYWRVQAAHTADTSDWSEAWSFETLNSVNLVSPANGAYVNDFFPLLTWQEVTGISGFQLQYDDNQDFSSPTEEMIDGDKNSHKILYSLEQDETYYWRIRAYENGDTTDWSAAWSFIIGEGPQGINDLLTDNSVSIYPNPASTDLFIEVNALRQEMVEVSILNLLGQSVIEARLDLGQGENKTQIGLNDLDAGLYIIQMKSGDESFMKKLVIDK